jgi:hypothetical protein
VRSVGRRAVGTEVSDIPPSTRWNVEPPCCSARAFVIWASPMEPFFGANVYSDAPACQIKRRNNDKQTWLRAVLCNQGAQITAFWHPCERTTRPAAWRARRPRPAAPGGHIVGQPVAEPQPLVCVHGQVPAPDAAAAAGNLEVGRVRRSARGHPHDVVDRGRVGEPTGDCRVARQFGGDGPRVRHGIVHACGLAKRGKCGEESFPRGRLIG